MKFKKKKLRGHCIKKEKYSSSLFQPNQGKLVERETFDNELVAI